jgi:DNA mismatch repair protein MutL
MPRIRVLDESTINKIAAGEVIENPASVVKELVENAMDAGATEIIVEIKGGGRQLIRISDNGCGMLQDDALLCFERHATSKICNVEDIEALMTMGFRGEAIPSIASISKFTLLTAPKKSEKHHEGTLIMAEGGKILTVVPAARAFGTTIEVKDLFFNVPVRKKFQKSPSYDAQEILKMLTILSLGYPHIRFELISDQRQLLDTAPLATEGDFQVQLERRIETVLGKDFFTSLCPLNFKQGEFQLNGYVGLPAYSRHNRTGQYLFINQRAVQSSLIAFAIREGYGTMLPSNRHPIFILHLRVPGALIDVNVHPQKKEVRLRQEQHLKECLRQAIQQSLQGIGFTEEIHEPQASFSPSFVPAFEPMFPPPGNFAKPLASSLPWEPIPTFSEPFSVKEEAAQPIFDFIPNKARVLATLPGYILLDPLHLGPFEALIKGQGGLCLVSQKAAYTRIYYERLLDQQETKSPSQPLLLPLTVEFAKPEMTLLKEHLEELKGMGFGIAEFGEHTFIVDAIPTLFDQQELQACLMAIAEDLKEFQDTRRVQREKEKTIALAAARRSSISKKRLGLDDAQMLLAQLLECQMPAQCPMGRPTWIHLSLDDLAKQF